MSGSGQGPFYDRTEITWVPSGPDTWNKVRIIHFKGGGTNRTQIRTDVSTKEYFELKLRGEDLDDYGI